MEKLGSGGDLGGVVLPISGEGHSPGPSGVLGDHKATLKGSSDSAMVAEGVIGKVSAQGQKMSAVGPVSRPSEGVPTKPIAEAMAGGLEITARARGPAVGGDVSEKILKAQELGRKAITGASLKDRQGATDQLIAMMESLGKQKLRAPLVQRDQLAEDLRYVDSQLQKILLQQEERPGLLEGPEDKKYTYHMKYGAALGRILCAAQSDQEVMSEFVLKASYIRRCFESEKKEIGGMLSILGSMEQAVLDEKALALLNDAVKMSRLWVLGNSKKEGDIQDFVEAAKQLPRAALLTLDLIAKTNPALLQRIRGFIEASDWAVGKIFLMSKESPQKAFKALDSMAKTNPALFQQVRANIEASDWAVGKIFLASRGVKACLDRGQTDENLREELKKLRGSIPAFIPPEVKKVIAQPIQEMCELMMSRCEKMRKEHFPPMQFVHENSELLSEIFSIMSRVFDSAEEAAVLKKFQSTKRWLDDIGQSLMSGQPDPVSFTSRALERHSTFTKANEAELTKLGLSDWATCIPDVVQVALDFERRKTVFTDLFGNFVIFPQQPGDPVTSVSVVQFAQKIFDAYPENMREASEQQSALRQTIGRLLYNLTQGARFDDISVPHFIHAMGTRKGMEYRGSIDLPQFISINQETFEIQAETGARGQFVECPALDVPASRGFIGYDVKLKMTIGSPDISYAFQAVIQEAQRLGNIARDSGVSLQERQRATEDLISLRKELQIQKAPTAHARLKKEGDLALVDEQLNEIFSVQEKRSYITFSGVSIGRGLLEGAGDAKFAYQRKYGTAIGEGLCKKHSGQELFDIFLAQSIDIRVRYSNREEADAILKGMEEALFDKLSEINPELCRNMSNCGAVLRCFKSGEWEKFIALAKSYPRIGLQVFDSMKTRGMTLELREAIERSDWDAGKLFLAGDSAADSRQKFIQAAHEHPDVFLDVARHYPRVALQALYEIGKTDSKVIETLRKGIDAGSWEAGKIFLGAWDAKASFDGEGDGQKTARHMESLLKQCEKLDPEVQEGLQQPIRDMMGSMVDYCERARESSPKRPSMEFLTENWAALASGFKVAERVIGKEEKDAILKEETKEWLQAGCKSVGQSSPSAAIFTAQAVLATPIKQDPALAAWKTAPLSEWGRVFPDIVQVARDFYARPPLLVDSKGEKILFAPDKVKGVRDFVAVAKFAQALFDACPETMRATSAQQEALRQTIGMLFYNATQGARLDLIAVLGIFNLGKQVGVAATYNCTEMTPMEFTINPEREAIQLECSSFGEIREGGVVEGGQATRGIGYHLTMVAKMGSSELACTMQVVEGKTP